MTTTRLIAVVQNGYAVFGIGKTLNEAIADAKEWTEDHDKLNNDLPSHSSTDGEMYWSYCTPALASEVTKRGGDIALGSLDDGTLCLPSEEPQ